MKVLTKATAIRQALRDLQPSRIVVAYVGADWRSFVAADVLEEIVLSPTLGTNPKAVEEIMGELGHEQVHFLDKLHAKFYIGHDTALLGSCNLSANGIGENGLLEAAVTVHGDGLRRLREQFDRYKLDAQRSYPTLKAKMDRLRKLQDETNRAQSAGILKGGKAASSITTYQSKLDRIHVIGLTEPDGEPNARKIAEQEPEVVAAKFDKYFEDWLQFEAENKVSAGDWFLCWWCTSKRRPDKRAKMLWIYAHCVVEHGMTSEDWPKFVGEKKESECCQRPPVPFDLDSATQSAIREVLESGKFPQLVPSDDWRQDLVRADAVTPMFLDAVKKKIAASSQR